MFVINKEATQELQVNLSDEYTLDYFLFALSGDGLTNQKLFFATPNFTSSPRFVSFLIEENSTEDLYNGVVSLPFASDLYCKIYNVATQTLSIPSSEPIWKGLWRVKTDTVINNDNEISITYKGYDPRQ